MIIYGALLQPTQSITEGAMLFSFNNPKYLVILEVWGRTHWKECATKEEADAWVNAILVRERLHYPHGDFAPRYYKVMP